MNDAASPVDLAAITRRLSSMPPALRGVCAGLNDADARWRPASPEGAWSILEVVCHLADEEAEDFKPRLERTLRNPREPWDALDLDGISERRGYRERRLDAEVERFARERGRSIAWLRGLEGAAIDWSASHGHPKFGPISAAMLLCGWAAHDALHLRQIAKRLFELAARDGGGASTAYAGEWKA